MGLRRVACALLVLASSGSWGQLDLDVAPGLEAARIWLATLDARRYGASWEDAAPMLRATVNKVEWETSLQSARGPLGVAIGRKIRKATCSRGTPADPVIEVCLIHYDTRFENRPLAEEVVTPMKGADGVWRVSAYVLR